jgi:menaquinone-dependent protoporphyrinogen oxidase
MALLPHRPTRFAEHIGIGSAQQTTPSAFAPRGFEMTAQVLVAYASKHGSTAEIAESIGTTLRGSGLEVDVWPASHCSSIGAYDVVVVGSAVYMNRWQPDGLDFLRRFEGELATRPTWLFSSGPTGGTPDAETKLAKALRAEGLPPGNAGRLASRIRVRGHVTFGGRIGEDMTGLFERWLPRGDWRDAEAVTAWACSIADAVSKPPEPVAATLSSIDAVRGT